MQSKNLSPDAYEIIQQKPRLWMYLLVTQILAEEFKLYESLSKNLINNEVEYKFDCDVLQLQNYIELLKCRFEKYKNFSQQLAFKFIAPMRDVADKINTDSCVDQIVNIGVDTAKIFKECLSLKIEVERETREFSLDMPPLVKEMFGEIFDESASYIVDGCGSFLSTLKKYGPIANSIFREASNKLMSGESGGDYKTALRHEHRYASFDVTKIEQLTLLLNHVESNTPDSKDESGFIYLLSNPSMPGLVKIGHTTRKTGTRVKELNTATGVPTPFEIVYDCFVTNSAIVEKKIHHRLQKYRVATNREFFQVSTSQAIRIIIEVSVSKD